uniref:Uncharacterized protein n=1 Tax=Avena sativa TaxID=4498 RepID=A0ACD5T6R0_AVESA
MDLVVGASMKSVLVKIEDMLSQDHALIRDVGSKLERISGELATVHASFSCYLSRLDRGCHAHGDEQIQSWARRVREVAYDAENRVDHVRLRLSRWPEPRGRGPIFAMPRWWFAICTRHVRRDIAAEIGGLMGQVEGLGEEGPVANSQLSGDNTDGDGDGASTSFQHVAQPAPLLTGVGKPLALGLEQAVADLPPWFASGGDKDPELRAVVIVGSGGLGKSTLAGALLSVFSEQFDSCATVLASRRFNLGLFLRILLKQIMPPFEYDELQLGVSDGWKDDELQEKVEEQFLDKRYIVVIDDVWSVPSWKIIQECLPENGKGSRVLVTTRDGSVATAIKLQQVYVHNLNPLDKDHSRILLQRELAGDNNQQFPCGNDSAASRILDKCGGVPLAIVAVAGFLANVPASDSIASRMEAACGSTFPAEQQNGTTPVQIMKEIFNICYNDLPAYLRTALLCLSIFPVGFSISRKRLIRWWIAQGFIAERHGKSVEQVAEESFRELITRNMIQPVEFGINGNVKTFQVHDVILENIVSASSEENFITVLDGCPCETVPAPAIKNVRWLSVHGSSNPLCVKDVKMSTNFLHVGSLTAFGTIKHLDWFTILQVLDLEGCGDLGAGQLVMICKMDLLKYLSLRRTGVKALPSKIHRLQFLETLDIRETNVRRLPRSIGRLKRMVHLLGGDKRRGLALLLTKEITEMSKLKTLSGIKIDRRSTAALSRMDNLTSLEKLSIYNVSQRKSLWFLSNSSSLTSLAVNDGFTGLVDELDFSFASFDHLRTLKISGKLSKVPRWMNSMQFLQELTLSLTSLKMATLELLSDLPMLCLLVFSTDAAEHYADVLIILKENASESGGEIFVPARGFHRLHTLHFSGVGLPLLSFLQGAMPELQRLKLRFRMIDGIYGLENLGNLHMVDLKVSKQASELAKEMVRQIKSSVEKHPKRPVMICDEYSEW